MPNVTKKRKPITPIWPDFATHVHGTSPKRVCTEIVRCQK